MNLQIELTCTVHNILKYLAHSFVLMSNLHHDVKVQCHDLLMQQNILYDNHMSSQVEVMREQLVGVKGVELS